MKSMTPNELLASKNYAVIRVDEQGNFRWVTDTYELEGSAISDAHTLSESVSNVSNGGYYEVVVIDHSVENNHYDTGSNNTVYADAFEALVRYMFCGLRQFNEQLDFGDEYHAYRDLLTFVDGYLSSAGVEIAPIVAGVTAEHHVRHRL